MPKASPVLIILRKIALCIDPQAQMRKLDRNRDGKITEEDWIARCVFSFDIISYKDQLPSRIVPDLMEVWLDCNSHTPRT